MTATTTPDEVIEAEAQLERLQERAADLMAKALAPASVVIARAAMNEAGIMRARRQLFEAHDAFTNAQTTKRGAYEAERAAKEAHETALSEAEWELDGRFVKEGNTTYLVDPCSGCQGKRETEAGAVCPDCKGSGEQRRAMTADERKAWKSIAARKTDAVKAAASALRKAENATATARDEIDAAEKRCAACRIDLEASTAIVNVFARAITVTKEQP